MTTNPGRRLQAGTPEPGRTGNARRDFSVRTALPALVLAAAVLAGTTGCTIMPGGSAPMTTDSEHPFDGTRTAEVVEKDFYDTIDDTIKQAGLAFPTWDRATEDGVMPTCAAGRKAGNKFSITLWGGSSPDPKAAVEKIKVYWKSKGWKIGNIFDETDAPNPGMQIGATSPTGILVVFGPTKNAIGPQDKADWTMIQVESDCTLDPSLNGVPTPKTAQSR
ncbi:hypothetical protein J7E83_08785 [Arthrobacter sp. ISL-48]|uniref:hypothetical protein n=1 Tax=Arthrobacter sp. ISL-48 TaxID=2819110 RepID=UPI001BEBF7E2|nr:hypothetical protein [Arthrobacter sp. ISL-48]MBT2532218.1 hypothetical protein [Arthrobacter sp. ISL-48]